MTGQDTYFLYHFITSMPSASTRHLSKPGMLHTYPSEPLSATHKGPYHTLPTLTLFSSFFSPPPSGTTVAIRGGSSFAPLAPERAQRSIQSRELDARAQQRK